MAGVSPLENLALRTNAYHLYVIRLHQRSNTSSKRDRVFSYLRGQNIQTNVHYLPVYLHEYYRRHFGYGEGLCPVAEAAYKEILSLPIHPKMHLADVDRVVNTLKLALRYAA